MGCDVCGAKGKLYRTLIEGTKMNVCAECAKYGRILGEVSKEIAIQAETAKMLQRPELESVFERIVSDFASKIRQKRASLGLTQEEFAKLINEKESVVSKLEAGELVPSIALAKKLEKRFGLKLIERYKEEGSIIRTETPQLTLGDALKVRARKG